jgi:hypothetical protein
MDEKSLASIDRAKEAAVRVLLHNARGPFQGLPRTAGWGYPEPYTRDLMISALGLLVTGNEELTDALRRTLVALATNQTPLGHIPSIAHDPATVAPAIPRRFSSLAWHCAGGQPTSRSSSKRRRTTH